MPRVLVADDNDDLRELMRVILLGDGYEVEVASGGQAAIAAHRRQPFDLIITDIFMPDQDGIETIGLLRKDFPQVKVLAISGGGGRVSSSSGGYLLTALQIGANAVLSKPFEPAALQHTVAELLAGPKR